MFDVYFVTFYDSQAFSLEIKEVIVHIGSQILPGKMAGSIKHTSVESLDQMSSFLSVQLLHSRSRQTSALMMRCGDKSCLAWRKERNQRMN